MAPKKNKTEITEELANEATAPVTEEITEAVEEEKDTQPVTSEKTPEEIAEEEKDTQPVTSEKTPEEIAEEARKAHFRYMRELVPVTPAPPRMGEDPNYPIGINGKLWLLPKGKTSMVPRYVADAFNQAEAAKGTQIENQAQLKQLLGI